MLEQKEIASTVKEEIIESVRQHFSLEAEKEILDSFFQQEEIEEDLNNSVEKGFDFFAFVRDCREKLELFLTKQENNENKQGSVEGSAADVYKSVNELFIAKNLENNREIKIEEKSSNQTSDRLFSESLEMNKTIVQIPRLSLKDALDLIRRFNGQNISLTQFLDGCQETLSIPPNEYETELAKLIRMRLYGDALNSIWGQNFKEISEISEFLETVYASAKTFHDWEGELARIKQKGNESVIIYLNRLKEIVGNFQSRKTRKAVYRKRRI